MTQMSFEIEFQKKKTKYAYVPASIACEMLNYVICPPEGTAQQRAVSNYVVQTIARLAGNQPQK